MTRTLAMAMAFAVTALVASAAQYSSQFFLQHHFDEAADPVPDARFNRVEPGVARKQILCVRYGRPILVHDVVSSRRADAGVWLSSLNRRLRHPISNHIPDSTPRPPDAFTSRSSRRVTCPKG